MDFFKKHFDIFAFLGVSVFLSACFIDNPIIAGIGFICSILLVVPSLFALFYGLIKYKRIEPFLFSGTQGYWDGLFLLLATLLYNVGYPVLSILILLGTVSHLIISFVKTNQNH